MTTPSKAVETFLLLLPRWLFVVTVLFVLFYVLGLTGAAIIWDRAVEFIPPRIGPSPKWQLKDELRRVHESIKTASDAHFARVQRWDAELSKMRQMATSPDFNTRWEARMNERGYEREVKELDERYGNSLKELSQVIEKIERRL